MYCMFGNIVGTEQHWKERIGTSAEGRGETGEKRDGEEKSCMPKIRLACLREDLFPSLYTSSPAFTPLYPAFTPLYPSLHFFTQPLHLLTNLFDSVHVYMKDCEVLLGK